MQTAKAFAKRVCEWDGSTKANSCIERERVAEHAGSEAGERTLIGPLLLVGSQEKPESSSHVVVVGHFTSHQRALGGRCLTPPPAVVMTGMEEEEEADAS